MTSQSDTSVSTGRPKLVYFQWDHTPQLRYAKYFMQHAREHIRCLEHYFDVVVVNDDCDYGAVCDRHQPDLALFEVGYQSRLSRRIDISNTDAHPQVPKAALLNADSWAWTRAGLLSDMDHWGIGVAFSIATTVHDYMPEALDDLFIWPNFIDPTVFRDYGAPKSVPIMLTGSQIELYPWRRRVAPLLRNSYPSLVCPAHSYVDASAARALSGERYARALNASYFSPSCGTMAGEVVRKHFEIPGSGCCLITERTPMVEAAGFTHLQNCVFADADDVLDIVDSLMADPDKLDGITRAGHDLVHSRHTIADRPQIYQWFMLQKDLPASRQIVQSGPFADVEAVERAVPVAAIPHGGGADRALLSRGYEALSRGDASKARSAFSDTLTFVSELQEGSFGLALCDLADDDAAAAADRLARLIETTTVIYNAKDPDPVEWAFYVYALRSLGREGEALRLVGWYPRLSHPALDRVSEFLSGADDASRREEGARHVRPSVHDRFVKGTAGWSAFMPAHPPPRGEGGIRRPARRTMREAAKELVARAVAFVLVRANVTALRPNLPPTRELDYLGNVTRRLRRLVRKSPVGETAASLRRRVKERFERRQLLRGAGAGPEG